MNFYYLALGSLAVWRLTHLLAAEDGPFHLLAWLRRQAGSGFLGELMDCFYCLSLWVAAPFALVLGSTRREKLLLWPALSAVAILLNRFADRVAPDAPVVFENPGFEGRELEDRKFETPTNQEIRT